MTNSLPSRVCVPARGCVCTCMHAVVQIRVHVIGCARVRPCACMICGMQAFASRSKCVHVHDVYVVPPIQSFCLPSFLCCPSHILPSFLHPSLPPFTYTLSLSLYLLFAFPLFLLLPPSSSPTGQGLATSDYSPRKLGQVQRLLFEQNTRSSVR